ncbi:MAG: hypothetical protein KC493_13495, partial [Bacteriovoracaceae bacterium]|nr:hypothetical protein [Bacteriovoracaceae bacterium]
MKYTFHHRESGRCSVGFLCKELLLKLLLLTSLVLVGCNGEVAQESSNQPETQGATGTPTPTPTPVGSAIVFPDNMSVVYDDVTKFISFSWTMVASPLEMAKVEVTKVSTGVMVLDQNTLNAGSINLGPIVEAGTLYNYKIYASDIAANLSTNFMQGQFETAPPPPPAPPAPTAPTLFNNAGLVYNDLLKKATITWDAPVDFVVGRVEIRDSGNAVVSDSNVLNAGTIDLSTLNAGEAHTYKIWAVEPVGGLNSIANVSGGFSTGGGVVAP